MFVLPVGVHLEVDKNFRTCLWKGKEKGRGGIKVAWGEVCLPFDKSGLVICNRLS